MVRFHIFIVMFWLSVCLFTRLEFTKIYCFDALILKKIKKYNFNIFQHEKYFENQPQSYFQTDIETNIQ